MFKRIISIIILFSLFAKVQAIGFYDNLQAFVKNLPDSDKKKVACVVAQMAGDVFGRPYELENFKRDPYSFVAEKDDNGVHLTDDSSRAWSTMDACLSCYLKTQGHFDERIFLLDFAENNNRWLSDCLFSVTTGRNGGGYGSGKNTRAANKIYQHMKKTNNLASFPTAEVGIFNGMKQFGNGTIMGLSPVVFAQDKQMAKKIAVNQCKVSNNQKDLIEFTEFVAEMQYQALSKGSNVKIKDFFSNQVIDRFKQVPSGRVWQNYFFVTLCCIFDFFYKFNNSDLLRVKLSSKNPYNQIGTLGEHIYSLPVSGYSTSEPDHIPAHNYWLFGDLDTLYNQDWLIPSSASGACLIGVIYAILKVCGEKTTVDQKDFQDVMNLCITMGHDVDTTAAIAGPLLAAFGGISCLPKNLVNNIFDNPITKDPELWQRMFFFYMNQMLKFSKNAELEPISESLLSQVTIDNRFKSCFIDTLSTSSKIRKDNQPASRAGRSSPLVFEQSYRPTFKDLGLGLTLVGSATGITFAGYKYGRKIIKKAKKRIKFNYFKKRAPKINNKSRRNLAKEPSFGRITKKS